MSGNYIGKGVIVQAAVAALVASGSPFVWGEKSLAVAVTDIAAGETGSAAISEVYELDCETADAIDAGESLDFDASTGLLTNNLTSEVGDLTGCCIAVAASPGGNGKVQVLLTPNTGTYVAS